MWREGVDYGYMWYQWQGFCEHGNEPSYFVKIRTFLD